MNEAQIELINQIRTSVHEDPKFEEYESTNVKDGTNCFSHAIGSTIPSLTLYRLGSLSNLKPLNQEYSSIAEVEHLLYEDLKILNLQIEKTTLQENIKDLKNQYKIILMVKIYADNRIFDFHFIRFDNLGYTEKYRTQNMKILNFLNTYSRFPWKIVGVYKITR